MDAEQLADIRAILGRGMSLYRADQKALLDEIDRLQATIQRVRELIQPSCRDARYGCTCDQVTREDLIRALEGGDAA